LGLLSNAKLIGELTMSYLFSSILLRTPLQSFQIAYDLPKTIEPIIEEGLYLASSDFWQQFQKRDKLDNKDREKIDISFAKYWIRSCSRATPYGTFAGTALVNISNNETNIIINDSIHHTRRSRLDMNLISDIINALQQLPSITNQVKLYTSNSVYELPNSFRFVEFSIQNKGRNYELISIQKTNEIKTILKHAKQGVTIQKLAEALVSSPDENIEDAINFIHDLWKSQLLVSELEPCITGLEPLDKLILQLGSLANTQEIVLNLEKVKKLIDAPNKNVWQYQEIDTHLKQLFKTDLEPNILQTDLFLSLTEKTINAKLLETLATQVNDLVVLSEKYKSIDLGNFKKSFYSKYEDKEVPLFIAIDSDLGVGYTNTQDIAGAFANIFNENKVKSNYLTSEFNHIQEFVISKYIEYLENNMDFIEINEADLNRLKALGNKFNFPITMFIMGSLLKKNGVLNPENFIFDLSVYGGPSGANLIGRFAHGNDDIYKFTKEILELEESEIPDAIYAEIVHLPQSRTGNVLLRPVLRKYEIPYVGASGATINRQIPVDDLMVSIRNGEVFLRSKKHNLQVIPKLTTAHNFGYNSLPIYKFLCDLQLQGMSYFNTWNWGFLGDKKYLPRVFYKNLILKKAQWKIEKNELAELPEKEPERSEFFKLFLAKRKMPNKMMFVENDTKLLVDFESNLGFDLLLHFLNRNNIVLLEEFIFTKENCVITDANEAPFLNEMIIPVFRNEKVNSNSAIPKITKKKTIIKRKYLPSSEWLYFKIYCGPKFCEKILKEVILKFIEVKFKAKRFEKFFFIRYKDDDSHLRIRFFNADIQKQIYVQKEFLKILQPFFNKGLIDKILVDTYSREVERYGGDIITEYESLFFNDSLAVLRLIPLLNNDENEKYRLLLAMRGIDIFLNDFGFTLIEKIRLISKMKNSFFLEFGGHANLQKKLNEKYRLYQQLIFSFMDPTKDHSNGLEPAINIYNIRSNMNQPIITSILKNFSAQNSEDKLFETQISLIHLFMNRLFVNDQRKYELIIYHFQEKYYSSQNAISKTNLYG